MTKFLLFLFFFFYLFNSPVYSSSGALETAGFEQGELSAVDNGTGLAEFTNGEDPGRPTELRGISNSAIDFSEYPKIFIIPKGVCEQSVPVMTIGE
jgi:hypothetical protein